MDLARKNTLTWIAITFLLFPLLLIAGMFMRTVQANAAANIQDWFYPIMTLHGVGMAGLWWVASLAGASRVLSRYVEPSERLSRFSIYGTVLGVILLLACVLVGKFAAGWYFLFPLPFKGTWPSWATVVFLLSIAVLGATWLIWTFGLLWAISRKYSLGQSLGWHYISGKDGPEVPPAIIIVTVTLIAAVACLLSGVIVLVLYFLQMLTNVTNDALLMKNLTFFFGHLLVNLSMYLGVALVYDVLPEYTGRPWKANKVVAISWNAVLAIVLLAYFHHLYMDFVQPAAVQYIGQVASYVSSIPAAVVSIFGALALVYRAPVKWNLGSSLLFLGLMGWAIGGIGAVIDSTILVNIRFHNTLWVPAHFHTYMIEGLVLIVLGYIYHYCQEKAQIPENLRLQKTAIGMLLVGGYGFVLMFYLSGSRAIPRRYATYPAELSEGALYSWIALAFITLFLIGFIVYLSETGKRWVKARAS